MNTLRTLILLSAMLRDLLLRYLPIPVVRMIVGRAEYAFIAHTRDLDDVRRKYPFARCLPQRFVEFWMRHLWPIIGSRITGLRSSEGREINGWLLFCPLTAKQMWQDPRLARKRILQTARLAERLGVGLIGLGALIPPFTRYGQTLRRAGIRTGLTTGHAYTSSLICDGVREAAKKGGFDLREAVVAIVGAAGSIGSICARILGKDAGKLLLIDRASKMRSLRGLGQKICSQVSVSCQLEDIKRADLVIVVTNAHSAILSAEVFKPGAIVIDNTQPMNVGENVARERPDVLILEGGIGYVPGVDCNFDLGLSIGEVFGCLGELLILAREGWREDFIIGRVTLEQIEMITWMAKRAGVSLAPFRSFGQYVTDGRFEEIRKIRRLNLQEGGDEDVT
jgi:predicted amino acid dehydrogenase